MKLINWLNITDVKTHFTNSALAVIWNETVMTLASKIRNAFAAIQITAEVGICILFFEISKTREKHSIFKRT